jgi:hypothetical protein
MRLAPVAVAASLRETRAGIAVCSRTSAMRSAIVAGDSRRALPGSVSTIATITVERGAGSAPVDSSNVQSRKTVRPIAVTCNASGWMRRKPGVAITQPQRASTDLSGQSSLRNGEAGMPASFVNVA